MAFNNGALATREHLPSVLLTFLEEQKITDKFLQYVNDQSQIWEGEPSEEFFLDFPDLWGSPLKETISWAVTWRNTEEGMKYWREMDNLYRRYVDEQE